MATGETTDHDVIVIGAGFAGMYLLHRLRDEQGLRVQVYERGSGVGGTWYWNRYPGARCDVESKYYSYSFDSELEQEWEWTERFPAQPELLTYANHVADRFDLRKNIQFDTSVESAVFDDATNTWSVTLADGTTATATYLVTAVGCLSASQIPPFDGIDSFSGPTYHTGRWPHEGVDFSGKRVGIIGTGSSGIQAIPVIAEQAAHLTVFQRTANFSLPSRNRPLKPGEQDEFKADYPSIRAAQRMARGGQPVADPIGNAREIDPATRAKTMDEAWAAGAVAFMGVFADTMLDEDANKVSAEYVHDRIHDIVKDPATADLLCAKTHPIGTKRICLDTNYFQTYNRDNVKLVGIADTPIERITEKGVQVSGTEYEFDAIVFATGFDAMTGPLNQIDIRGVDGIKLKDEWSAGPRTYLGIASAGFPNMFMVTAPGSPSVLTNMIPTIEQHVDWITDSIQYNREHGIARIEAKRDEQDQWVQHVNEVAHTTLYPKAASWYMGANIPGKPRVFMPYIGGLNVYRDICDDVATDGYRGFTLSPAA
ncbi:MAG: flavin-containing monooxygenase [Cumulibacter sp.]